MSRNGTGTMSVVNTFVSGQVITASSHNENATDFAAEITNSVAADGQTTMTAPLKHSSGTAALPSMTFGSSTNRGFYKGTSGVGVAVGGVSLGEMSLLGPFRTVGEIIDYPSVAFVPPGWLQCYGQSLLRATYPDLFTLIGTSYGAVDGTHFTIPDCRGVVIAGMSNMGGVDRNNLAGAGSLNATLGLQTATIDQTNLPNVTLTTSIGAGQGSHVHPSLSGGLQSGEQASGGGQTGWLSGGSTAIAAATLPAMSGTTPLGGSGTAMSIVQPTLVLVKLIYTGVA